MDRLTKNDGHENDAPSKLQGMKMQDTKTQDIKLQNVKVPQKWQFLGGWLDWVDLDLAVGSMSSLRGLFPRIRRIVVYAKRSNLKSSFHSPRNIKTKAAVAGQQGSTL